MLLLLESVADGDSNVKMRLREGAVSQTISSLSRGYLQNSAVDLRANKESAVFAAAMQVVELR